MTEQDSIVLKRIAEALERLSDAAAALERHTAIYEASLAMQRERHATLLELDKAALAGWTRPPPEPPTVVSLAEYVRGEIMRQLAERDGGES